MLRRRRFWYGMGDKMSIRQKERIRGAIGTIRTMSALEQNGNSEFPCSLLHHSGIAATKQCFRFRQIRRN